MTEASLIRFLRIAGWTSIAAAGVGLMSSYVDQFIRMTDLGVEPAIRAQTTAIMTIGYILELPLTLTAACLCLMAAKYLSYPRITLETIFE